MSIDGITQENTDALTRVRARNAEIASRTNSERASQESHILANMSGWYRTVAILATLLFITTGASASTFPRLSGEDLDGRVVLLPQAVKDHPALLIISFARKAQAQTARWGDKVCKSKHDARLMCLQIAVLEDVPSLFRGMVKRGIAKSIPQTQHSQFLLLFQGEGVLKRLTAFGKEEDAYVVLLDSRGEIRWQGQGPIDDHKEAELVQCLHSAK